MTKDEIIAMAEEAGFGNYAYEAASIFERFAALVAARERELCALVADDSEHIEEGRGYYDQLGDANATARNIAAAIRARGEQS